MEPRKLSSLNSADACRVPVMEADQRTEVVALSTSSCPCRQSSSSNISDCSISSMMSSKVTMPRGAQRAGGAAALQHGTMTERR